MAEDIEGDDGERKFTPEELQLPKPMVERIYQAVRLVGLPLAVETGDAGVYLEREGPIDGPIDHVVFSWHSTNKLFDAAEDKPSTDPAEVLMSATVSVMDDAIAKLLEASGLVVAKHPYTKSWAVWGADGPSITVAD